MNKLAMSICLVLGVATVEAQEVEEVVVVGTTVYESESNPSTDVLLLESLIPEATQAGGYGGFSGYTERGTQTIHTSVFRNGVPANDAGSGWYDFGHDYATGSETIKVVNGVNSVLYGSGSLGGTVFIKDDLSKDVSVVRLGDKHQFMSHTAKGFNLSYFNVDNGSVRSDNDESDNYLNMTAKGQFDTGEFTTNVSATSYDYDYDNCYTASFSQSNDCSQLGTKGSLSVRNDNYTFGYSFNDAKYKTEGVETYSSDAERAYVDTRHTIGNHLYGGTVEYEKYEDMSQNNISAYALFNFTNTNIGIRITEDTTVGRIGYESGDFFISAGTSYRNPTLYELNGDAWTAPNFNLDPEEALGYELGYGNITYFNYHFSEGIDYSFASSQFVNTGSYDTHGVRYNNSMTFDYLDSFVGYELGYTDSDQPRVAKYKAIINSIHQAGDYTLSFTYTGLFDRKPGPYDGIAMLDNVSSLDYKIESEIAPNYLLSATIRDILDKTYEYLPGYNSGGVEILITLQYRP
jgi:hypothetical protein